MTPRPCRLLYVVNIPRFFLTHRLPLARAARNAGFEVHVATSGDDPDALARIRADGFPAHVVPIDQHGTSPVREAQAAWSIYRLYRRLRPELVHHVGLKATLYGGLAARAAGVPAAIHALSGLGRAFSERGARARVLRSVLVPLLGVAVSGRGARVLFQNPEDRDRLVSLGVLAADRSLVIRGSGVDPSAFRPLPEPEGIPVVLFAGRILWSKGIADFVAAARRLAGRARFVVAALPEPGNPDEVPAETIRAWCEARLIEWWGQRDDMPEVIRRSHVVCLPTSYGEGVPKILIEGAASGRALVATDAPGCREIVRPGENGVLVREGDLEDLVRALASLIDDGERRREMGRRGTALAQAEFSLELVNRSTLDAYRELLEGRTRGATELTSETA